MRVERAYLSVLLSEIVEAFARGRLASQAAQLKWTHIPQSAVEELDLISTLFLSAGPRLDHLTDTDEELLRLCESFINGIPLSINEHGLSPKAFVLKILAHLSQFSHGFQTRLQLRCEEDTEFAYQLGKTEIQVLGVSPPVRFTRYD